VEWSGVEWCGVVQQCDLVKSITREYNYFSCKFQIHSSVRLSAVVADAPLAGQI
jgi:hypothetical protein